MEYESKLLYAQPRILAEHIGRAAKDWISEPDKQEYATELLTVLRQLALAIASNIDEQGKSIATVMAMTPEAQMTYIRTNAQSLPQFDGSSVECPDTSFAFEALERSLQRKGFFGRFAESNGTDRPDGKSWTEISAGDDDPSLGR